jgi:flagellar biosynthesis protein FlhF
MRTKSYFADSVHEAMERARFELGPEALLLSSKKAPEPISRGIYEVVFGLSSDTRSEEHVPAQQTSVSQEGVFKELAELRKQIEMVQRSISGQPETQTSNRPEELDDLRERLIAADFSQEMAEELLRATEERTPDSFSSALLDTIESRFTVAPELGIAGKDQRVILFAGPPGAGKTTTLVKLAVKYGVAERLPVQILSTDALSVGGAEQLLAYARIIGAGFQAVATRSALEQALYEFSSKKLILIDSPGFGPDDIGQARELLSFLRHQPQVEAQLILPATLRPAALCSALNRFSSFRPSKLIFTHLDEVGGPGCILEPAIRSGLPISFLANGQQIPEDIVEASKPKLRQRVAARLTKVSSTAA